MADATLLPCRECGSECRVIDGTNEHFAGLLWVCSNHCKLGGSCDTPFYLTEDAWNTRQPQPPSDLEQQIDNLLGSDPICGGRVCSETVEAIASLVHSSRQLPLDDAVERASRRVVHELRLSERVFHDYGVQHQEKAEGCEPGFEREARWAKAKRNYGRAAACKAALEQYDAALSAIPSDDGLIKALEGIANAVRIGAETDVQAWANLAYACQHTAREALSRHKAPLSDEMEICDVCGGAGGDNQHSICGKCYGAGGYRKAPLSVAGDDVPIDSGMSGDAVALAEQVWANLPTGNRTWAGLATHEKALVCHTVARLTALQVTEGDKS